LPRSVTEMIGYETRALDPAVDLLARLAERTRHAGDVAVVLAQQALQLDPSPMVCPARPRRTSGHGDPFWLIVQLQGAIARHDHRDVQRALQLSHVARPGPRKQLPGGRMREHALLSWSQPLEQRLHDEGEILTTLAQRWQHHVQAAQSRIQVGT